jgi:hypothetical protein
VLWATGRSSALESRWALVSPPLSRYRSGGSLRRLPGCSPRQRIHFHWQRVKADAGGTQSRIRELTWPSCSLAATAGPEAFSSRMRNDHAIRPLVSGLMAMQPGQAHSETREIELVDVRCVFRCSSAPGPALIVHDQGEAVTTGGFRR